MPKRRLGKSPKWSLEVNVKAVSSNKNDPFPEWKVMDMTPESLKEMMNCQCGHRLHKKMYTLKSIINHKCIVVGSDCVKLFPDYQEKLRKRKLEEKKRKQSEKWIREHVNISRGEYDNIDPEEYSKFITKRVMDKLNNHIENDFNSLYYINNKFIVENFKTQTLSQCQHLNRILIENMLAIKEISEKANMYLRDYEIHLKDFINPNDYKRITDFLEYYVNEMNKYKKLWHDYSIKQEKIIAEMEEVARMEAAREEAARMEAARKEAAREEAARMEAARKEAARKETQKDVREYFRVKRIKKKDDESYKNYMMRKKKEMEREEYLNARRKRNHELFKRCY